MASMSVTTSMIAGRWLFKACCNAFEKSPGRSTRIPRAPMSLAMRAKSTLV